MKNRFASCLAATICAAGCGSACALDLVSDDLRLGYTVVGSGEHFKVNGADGDFSWDKANRYSLDMVLGINAPVIGVLLGGGIALDDRRLTNSSGTQTDRTGFVQVEGGVYGNLVSILRLELLPFIGVGRSRLDTPGSGEETSPASEVGVNLNLVVHFPVLPLAAGVGVGLLHTQSNHSFSGSQIDLRGNDATGNVFVALSF